MNPVELAQYTGWHATHQASNQLSEVSQYCQSGTTSLSTTQGVGFIVIALVLAVVLWRVACMVAMRDGRSYYSAKRLFQQLCRLHELDWPSRRLLRRLAQARQLDHPAQLFLEPAWFEAAEIPATLRHFQPQLAVIQQRLFDERTL